jgi:hypothetical protein
MLVSYCVLGKWTQFHSAYEATVPVITESMQDNTDSLLEILGSNTTSKNGMVESILYNSGKKNLSFLCRTSRNVKKSLKTLTYSPFKVTVDQCYCSFTSILSCPLSAFPSYCTFYIVKVKN